MENGVWLHPREWVEKRQRVVCGKSCADTSENVGRNTQTKVCQKARTYVQECGYRRDTAQSVGEACGCIQEGAGQPRRGSALGS